MPTIADHVDAVRSRINRAAERAGRDPGDISLLAVTKRSEPAVMAELLAAGVGLFGENRVDHLKIMAASAPEGAAFHYMGRVQSRQFKDIVPHCAVIHSLHDPSHVPKLARICRELGRKIDVFCQVNTGGEAQKAGVLAQDLPQLMEALSKESDVITPLGLMTMAPNMDLEGVTEGDIRKTFAACRGLAEDHRLPRLSMGMSGDFEIAIEEGATDVRIGTILFP